MTELFLKKEVYMIVGCAMEVHRELGPGYLESVYQEALEIEFRMQGIPYVRDYLKTTMIKVGVLLNFGAACLEHKRFVNFFK